jgi:hypothetical protein
VAEVLGGGVGVVDQVDDAIADLAQVVRRDVGGHANGDARRAVEQQIGQARWQNHRLFAVAIVVGLEVYRVAVDIGQQLVGDGRHLRLSIPHGCCGIIIYRVVDEHTTCEQEVVILVYRDIVDILTLVHMANGDDAVIVVGACI